MALDAQRNWTVSMAENLECVQRETSSKKLRGAERTTDSSMTADMRNKEPRQPVHLPDEIILQILDYVQRQSDSQRSLASCSLLSRQWHTASVPLLYRSPRIKGKNFDTFVRTTCPSINQHIRKSPLADLIRVLDMSSLVHSGSKSWTARLLGRVKNGLEVFVAPQASFAVNCFPALAKCYNMRMLDLSLVSESPSLPMLFRAVKHLAKLKVFRLPRSSGFGVHHKTEEFIWPPNLEDLHLSGGIDAHFLYGIVAFPLTLRSLTIEHCPLAKGLAVHHLLTTAVAGKLPLRSLKIAHLPRLGSHALDDVLLVLPDLEKLSVSVDYITPALFDDIPFHHRPCAEERFGPFIHGLRTLELTNSGSQNVEDKVSPIDIIIAIDEGVLPKLRQVRVVKSLLWHSNLTKQDAEALADELQDASQRDWEQREWIFGSMTDKEYVKADPKAAAGVWTFDG